jgi:hypothetical protein
MRSSGYDLAKHFAAAQEVSGKREMILQGTQST